MHTHTESARDLGVVIASYVVYISARGGPISLICVNSAQSLTQQQLELLYRLS